MKVTCINCNRPMMCVDANEVFSRYECDRCQFGVEIDVAYEGLKRQERAKKVVDLLDEEEGLMNRIGTASSEEEVDDLLDDLFAKLDE